MASEPLRTRVRWSAYVAATAPREGRFPYRSPAAIERVQARRVRAAVAHAYRHVPHYRSAIDGLGMRPGDFRTAADLARLPLLERADVQGDPLAYTSGAESSRYSSFSASGITGAPVAIYHDRSSLAQAAGHRRRRDKVVGALAGQRLRFRLLHIRPEGSTGQRARRAFDRLSLLPEWLRNEERRVSLLEPFETVIDAVNDFRPDVISSIGSYVEGLFLHLHRQDVRMHLPSVVTYGFDELSAETRRLLTEELGVAVLGFYGSTEVFNIGFECERHRGYHLNVDFCPLRIVDRDGNDVSQGQQGEVVISNLSNRGTMLLNYRLGHLARLIPERCECGRSLPLLARVGARIGEWVEDAAGRRIHPLAFSPVLNEEAESVWRWQIEQRAPGDLSVPVLAKAGSDRDSLRKRIERGLSERLGPGGRVAVRFVDDLPRTGAGKAPYLVSSSGDRSM